MILMSDAALVYFRSIEKLPAEYVDKNGDLYRAKEDGGVFVLRARMDPNRFTKDGAFLGVLKK
jgi:hypothetical protein